MSITVGEASPDTSTVVDSLKRVVALIDMDCFYCACERALQPELLGKPLVVVQYNPFEGDGSASSSGVKSHPPEPAHERIVARDGEVVMPSAENGSIIAVSYEARERGVTRFMRGKEARDQCPELIVMQVPTAHGKSDMNMYRTYGAKVRQIVTEVCGPTAKMEKASVDEIYVDITLPARSLLAATGIEGVVAEMIPLGTHVAGAAEGESEAAMGQQSKDGPLSRGAFRAGHSGQVERSMDSASCRWWKKPPGEWQPDEELLAAGSVIVMRARTTVTQRLGFTCSAGIAANKILAKLCGGLHKPNQQTLLPPCAVQELLDPLPIDRLRGFGGKLGEILKRGRPELGLTGFDSAGALRKAGQVAVSQVLRGEWAHPEETAANACRMAAGGDDAPVEERPHSKSVGAGKNFSGSRGGARRPLDDYDSLEGWVREFAEDVWARLQEEEDLNERTATQLVVSVGVEGGGASHSKRCTLRPGVTAITSDAMSMLRRLTSDRPPHHLGITGVGLAGDSFVSMVGADRGALKRMFQKAVTCAEVGSSSHQGRHLEEPKAKRTTQAAQVVIDVSDDGETINHVQVPVASCERWSCEACTFLNPPSSRCCDVCEKPRESRVLLEPAQPTVTDSMSSSSGGRVRGRGRGRGRGSHLAAPSQAGIVSFFQKAR